MIRNENTKINKNLSFGGEGVLILKFCSFLLRKTIPESNPEKQIRNSRKMLIQKHLELTTGITCLRKKKSFLAVKMKWIYYLREG